MPTGLVERCYRQCSAKRFRHAKQLHQARDVVPRNSSQSSWCVLLICTTSWGSTPYIFSLSRITWSTEASSASLYRQASIYKFGPQFSASLYTCPCYAVLPSCRAEHVRWSSSLTSNLLIAQA